MSDSLLDVFVDVNARGLPQTEQDLQDFINRVSAAFGGLNAAAAKVVVSAGSAATKKAAASVLSEFREEILKFEKQKFEFDFQVRLLGDQDARRQLSDIQSEVQAAKREFALATDDSGRQFAVERIRLAQQELSVLEQSVEAARQRQGLAEPSVAAGDRAKVFQQIRDDAAELNLQLSQTQKLVGKAGDPRLALSFGKTAEEAQKVNLELQKAIRNKDFINAEAALAKLQALQSAIAAARRQAEDQIDLKLQLPDLKKQFSAAIRDLDQDLIELGAGKLGFLDAEQKKSLLFAKAQLQALKDEFRAISTQAEVTNADILRMAEILQQIEAPAGATGPAARMREIFGAVSDTSRSFNTLNNNAYQFGQLIEDAAIGYELNGISGALRGAGNNASFLLSNMVANSIAAGSLSAKMGFLLTTLSGVGVAAAMIILPRMIEWLQSLDDIDMKVKDIADTLKKEFENVTLRVDLELDQAAEVRALAEVQGVIDAIEAAIDRAEESEALRLKITAILDNQSIQDVLTEATTALGDVANAAQSQIAAIEARAETLRNRALARGGNVGPSADFLSDAEKEQIKTLETLRDTAIQFGELRQQLFEDSKAGIVDPNALQAAKDSLTEVIRELESLRGKVSEADAKKLEENIAAARDELGKLNEDAQKLQAILDADAAAMDALRESATKISDELQFMSEVNQGNFAAEETVLFDIEKQKQALGEAAQELIDLKGATDEVINTLEDLAQKTQIEIVIKGETELRKLNDELVDLSVKIKDVNEEIAQNNIEAAKKQQDAQIKAAERVADLQAKLQDIAAQKAFEKQKSAIESQIDFLRSQLEEFQPDQFALGTLGTQAFGIGANQIETQIGNLELQLRNLEAARQQTEEAKRIAEINKQIAETQTKLADELRKIEEDRAKAEENLMIEMRGLGEIMAKLEEQEARLEEAIRNFDPTVRMPAGLPAGPAAAAEAAVMGSEWLQGVFEQLMQSTPRIPPGPWSAIDGMIQPQFRPEEPQFAPEDIPAIPDAAGMQGAQAQAMDAAFSSADFKSSSLEGLIDQSNRLLSTLGAAVDRLDVTARYA